MAAADSDDENAVTVCFDQMLAGWPWRAIADCPGRYSLPGAASGPTVEDLLGVDAEYRVYRVPGARDEVVVAARKDFGLISYRRSDGRFVHTLNTLDGLRRKLASLGIEPPAGPLEPPAPATMTGGLALPPSTRTLLPCPRHPPSLPPTPPP